MHNKWNPAYGTRLNDGSTLPLHDDWDCLYDLIHAGYVHSLVAPLEVALTAQGEAIAYKLRSHKAHGGRLGGFRIVEAGVSQPGQGEREVIEMVLAVTYGGTAFIVEAPEATMKRMDGSACEDNNFINYPVAPGIYRCQVEHTIVCTTDEGVEECEEGFRVLNVMRMVVVGIQDF